MPIMPYILGLIGSLITAVLITLFNQWTKSQFHTLSLWFVIPAGGIIVGLGGSLGFFLGKKITHTKFFKIDYLLACLLGISTFFSVNYLAYRTTHVVADANNQTNFVYQFSPPPGSLPLSQLMDFKNYIEMINSSSTQEFRHHGAKVGEGLEIGQTATTVLFYLQVAGAGLGAFCLALFLSDSKYCDKCRKYYKNKLLKSFDIEKLDTHIGNLNQNLRNGLLLKKSIEDIEDKAKKAVRYGQITVEHCPSCYAGQLLIQYFVVDTQGQAKEMLNLKQVLALDREVALQLAKK